MSHSQKKEKERDDRILSVGSVSSGISDDQMRPQFDEMQNQFTSTADSCQNHNNENAVEASTYLFYPPNYDLLTSLPNADDFDETKPHEETFYAYANEALCDGSETSTPTVLRDDGSNSMDFRLLADKSLQILETEYHQTVEQDPNPNEIPHTHFHNDVDESSEDFLASPNILRSESEGDIDHNNQKNFTINIDSEVIKNAMESIKVKVGPSLNRKLSTWRPRHREYAPFTIGGEHTIIPKKPLLAFKKQTSKAQAASANLTRSATFAEAIRRIFLPGCTAARNYDVKSYWQQDDVFVIHCIGADLVECQSIKTITKTCEPFVRWFHQYNDSRDDQILRWPNHIRIELVGPCVPLHATKFGILNIMPKDDKGNIIPGRLESATIRCRNCLYHDYLSELEAQSSDEIMLRGEHDEQLGRDGFDFSRENWESTQYPNLVMAFNAGIWGYDSWNPTLRKLLGFSRPIPFVITSYTLPEAEDDEDALGQVITPEEELKTRCFWPPEINPYASQIIRETKSSINNYFENGAWQAYLMGNMEPIRVV